MHGTTYAQLQRHLADALAGFLEVQEARAEARRWLIEGLGLGSTWLLAHGEDTVPSRDVDQVAGWLDRRRAGEPWSYILGWAPFRGRRFKVTRDTLIPRPETELVLEAALDVGRRLGVLHAVDVGTGSGILAVCMALETDWEVRASDISRGALAVARENAAAHGARVAFHKGDLLGPLPDPLGLVVSNPPYVDPADEQTLQRELAFEPRSALFAEDRGLALATALLRQARVRSAPGVVLEIGAGQGAELQARAEGLGWGRVAVHRDFAGHDRVLMALA
ncbi:peptide chain release factor N(5)-glutamine methyltransferase [Mesoterricola sediminis]|uniref:peptide chain release factor N(5)-glutamine methyltransferase n=1 Tax=Mesoterricola sediminis TaxID=2927980 RepID=A0AA48GTB2_9BACT|nr:peptide chain release factor N(5)-glutamine methyltransferase [Mesoterricola sediminis]BDU77202.1 release factor glutamine methyltransferase [Mesoterricola sediminis]